MPVSWQMHLWKNWGQTIKTDARYWILYASGKIGITYEKIASDVYNNQSHHTSSGAIKETLESNLLYFVEFYA